MKWTILIILIAYFVAMFIIGLIANRKSKTVTDYYVAGRGLGGVITALVYMSSLVSAGALVRMVHLCGVRCHHRHLHLLAAAFRQSYAPFQKVGSADGPGLSGGPF